MFFALEYNTNLIFNTIYVNKYTKFYRSEDQGQIVILCLNCAARGGFYIVYSVMVEQWHVFLNIMWLHSFKSTYIYTLLEMTVPSLPDIVLFTCSKVYSTHFNTQKHNREGW